MRYYEHIRTFLPSYKKQYFICKMQDDISSILDIKENIWKNWNLTKLHKKELLKEIGLVE